jgi:hypothetical protein
MLAFYRNGTKHWAASRSKTGPMAMPSAGRPLLDDVAMLPDVHRLKQELHELVHSWEYAFAMGHGCSVGDHPDFRATRQRAADLRARIAELSE